jgi:hypothetical protein
MKGSSFWHGLQKKVCREHFSSKIGLSPAGPGSSNKAGTIRRKRGTLSQSHLPGTDSAFETDREKIPKIQYRIFFDGSSLPSLPGKYNTPSFRPSHPMVRSVGRPGKLLHRTHICSGFSCLSQRFHLCPWGTKAGTRCRCSHFFVLRRRRHQCVIRDAVLNSVHNGLRSSSAGSGSRTSKHDVRAGDALQEVGRRRIRRCFVKVSS